MRLLRAASETSLRFRDAGKDSPSYGAVMARTRRTRIAIVLTAVMAIAALPSGRPASADALGNVPLQPGAPMIDSGSYMQGSLCTLNFVFKDKAKKDPKTYIGTSSSCTYFGQRVQAPKIGTFGTVVFTAESHDPSITDGHSSVGFALIEIDPSKLKYVSRVVRGFGSAPKGYTTSRKTSTGDPLITHGYPVWAVSPAQAVTRVGVLGNDNSARYWSSIQPNIQDKGAPVIRADGMAVGMSAEETSFWGTWLPEAPPIARYQTVEGLLKELRSASAGFNVTLA